MSPPHWMVKVAIGEADNETWCGYVQNPSDRECSDRQKDAYRFDSKNDAARCAAILRLHARPPMAAYVAKVTPKVKPGPLFESGIGKGRLVVRGGLIEIWCVVGQYERELHADLDDAISRCAGQYVMQR